MGKVIVVASGKGGVGKTTLTANIGAALAVAGKSVLLMDADLNLRNLDTVLGLRENVVFDIEDIFRGRKNIDEAAVTHPRYPSMALVSAPLTPPADPVLTAECLAVSAQKAAEQVDFVLIDMPAGIGDIFNRILRPGMKGIVVVTADRTSVGDGEITADIMRKKGLRDIRMIVNRVRPGFIKRGYAPDIDDIIDSVSLQLLGLVPEDGKVISSGNTGLLLSDMERSRAKIAVTNISRRLCGDEVPLYKFWK